MVEDRLIVSVSGVRGTVGGSLSPVVACEFGCTFGTMLGGSGTVAVGRDTRPSGPMLVSAVKAGLLGSGMDVVDLGVASTPGIALMTKLLKAAGGVAVTASHNPAQYNGLKFLQPSGTGLTKASAETLKSLWESLLFRLADTDHQGTDAARPTRTGCTSIRSARSSTKTPSPPIASKSCWTASTAPAAWWRPCC